VNGLINLLVMATLFFTGMAQSGTLPPRVGYGVAGCTAAIAVVLAVVRYRQRKGRGE
jgi:hypothetical protein